MGARATSFSDFPKYLTSSPFFYGGILFSNGSYGPCTKERTLVAFLRYVGPHFKERAGHKRYYPRVIVMVDEKKGNLEETEKVLKEYDTNIIFMGLEYTKGLTYGEGEICEADFKAFWENLAKEAKMLAPQTN